MNIWQEDTVTDSNQQLCHVAPCLQKLLHILQSRPHAGVVERPSNVSPVGHLIRSNHTVAHTSGLLYLHLNHLIIPEKISPHNWMKRRNRSVTLACPTFISCLTSGCSGEKETPALVLIELRLDSQPEQRKGETGRLRPEMCMIMYAACLNTVVEFLRAQF